MSSTRAAGAIVVFVLLLAACSSPGGAGSARTTAADPTATAAPPVDQHAAPAAVDPWEVYDPVRAGEAVPAGYLPLLARDDILPVYQPRFVGGADVDWGADTLVIGVDLEGEARAYPVAFLTWREMVIDDHRGIPTLVTW